MDIRCEMLKSESFFKDYACFDKNAVRLKSESVDIRGEFFRDSDRIIYSKSYFRYMDKTQVFTNKENDHISRRMSHVQMVSKIARTIGRALSLNEDLIEAIALGHDLGHVPFGHLGESFLNEISLENGEGVFMHNVQSVRDLMVLENNGKGLNLTIQVLDGILCHNGELVLDKYCPVIKGKDKFLSDYYNCYKSVDNIINLRPMTLEGCVVRISDVISYLGRDIEDAIMLGVLSLDNLPNSVTDILGYSNSDIINTIVLDIIENSMNKSYITMSPKINKAICDLKDFNYKYIYNKIYTDKDKKHIREMFRVVFDSNMFYLKNNVLDENIFRVYLSDMTFEYRNNTSFARIVIDYIAGMTDEYFFKEYNKIIDKKNI